MTRQGRSLPNPFSSFLQDANNYDKLFASLFETAIKLDGFEKTVDEIEYKKGMNESYVLRTLYLTGRVGYSPDLKIWLPCYGEGGTTLTGNYRNVRLYGQDGFNQTFPADKAYYIKATSTEMILADVIRRRAVMLANLDNAIAQNLDAIKETTVIITDDEELAGKVKRANTARSNGEAMVVLPRSAMSVSEIDTIKTGADYLVTQLINDRRSLYIDTMHIVGVRTPLEKTERLVVSEQAAQNAEADAYIASIIKYLNIQFKALNLPVEAKYSPLRFPTDELGERLLNGDESLTEINTLKEISENV